MTQARASAVSVRLRRGSGRPSSGRAGPAPDQAASAGRPGADGGARAAVRAAGRRPRRRLSLVACPAGFGKSTLLAAWRAGESAHRPVAWVTLDEGDDDAVVLWSHVIEALGRACPGLGAEALAPRWSRAPLLEVVLPRLVNALVEQGEVVLVLDDFHRLSSAAARESVAWFVDHLPASVQLVLVDPRPTRRCRSARCAPTASSSSCGPTTCASPPTRRASSSTAASGSASPRRRRAARRADRGLARRASTWRRCRSPARRTRHALVRAFDGTSAHVVDFLVGEVLAALRARSCRRFMLRTSVLERLCAAAVRRGARRATARPPRWSRSPARTCSSCRSTTSAAGSASTTCSPSSCASSWSGASRRWSPELHRRAYAWHRASGTTDEAIHHARRGRRVYDDAGRADRRDLGPLRQRRPDGLRPRLAARASRRRCSTRDARLLLVKAWVLGAARARGRHARRHWRGSRARRPRRRAAAGRLRLAGVEPAVLQRHVRVGRRRRRAGAWRAVGGARRAGLAVVAGGHVGARLGALLHGDLDLAERWLGETVALGPRPSSGSSRWPRSRTCR